MLNKSKNKPEHAHKKSIIGGKLESLEHTPPLNVSVPVQETSIEKNDLMLKLLGPQKDSAAKRYKNKEDDEMIQDKEEQKTFESPAAIATSSKSNNSSEDNQIS